MKDTEVNLGGWHRRTVSTLIILGSCLVLGSLPTITARNLMKPSKIKTSTHQTNHDSSVCSSSSCRKTAETMIKSLNEKQDPCDDFYEFSCGGLAGANLKVNSIEETTTEAYNTMKNLLESNTSKSSSAVTKTRRYYYSCLEERDKKETIPKILIDVITEIGGWHILPNTMLKRKKFDLQKLILEVNKKCHHKPLLFHWDKNLESFDLILRKEGIYEDNDTIVMDKLIKICRMMGAKESEARAQFLQVIKLRKELLEITAQSDAEEEDSYDSFTLQEWQNATPFLNWSEYFNGAFSSTNFTRLYNESLYVDDAEYFHRLGEVITKYNKTAEGRKTLVSFVMGHLTQTLLDYLNATHTEENSTSQALCLSETIQMFRAPVIALFVRQAFTNKTKSQVEIMSKNIRRVYKEIFNKAVWMNAATQKAALKRIDSIHETIGFPDYILNTEILDRDFEELMVDPVRYYHNKLEHLEFEYLKNARWSYAYLINNIYKEDSSIIIYPLVGEGARYEPDSDLVFIPASVMQLPIYYDDNTMSFNYGALGSIIGHELAHAIWSNSSSHDWILEEDEAALSHLDNEIECIKDQYSDYTISGQRLNGTQTWAEDIADYSGLKASFYAYLDYSKNAKVNYTLPGVNYNHRQQFFISFAQTWCESYTEDKIKMILQIDPHSVTKYRVIGSLSNLKEFSEEFNCPVGSKMNPEHKCILL